MWRKQLGALASLCLGLGALPAVAVASDWNDGDVFAGIASGTYNVYDNSGNFKEPISDGLGGFTTGCAFNPDRTVLYTTNFSNARVPTYQTAHPHALDTSINPGAQGGAGTESIVFDQAGNFYVGNAQGNTDVQKYDSSNNFLQSFNVATETVGSDWIDLASDQRTLFYTSEGRRIMRYDLQADTQLPDFTTLPGGGNSFALRLLPPGDGSGGLIVADRSEIRRLDGSGNVVQAYDVAGEDNWFSLNLDPSGQSFWSGDFGTNNFYRFNIATGAVEVGPIPSGGSLFGLCVKGEPTAALPPEPPPGPPGEPPAAAPQLVVDITGRKKQKPVGPQVPPANQKAKNANGKVVSVKVTCHVKPCTADLKGKAKAPGEKVKLKGPEISLQPGETERVRLRANKSLLAELKAALRAGEKGKAKITGTATAPDGEKAEDKFKVKLRG